MHPILDIVRKQKQGISEGIYSVCSSNRFVIEATLEKAKEDGSYALIEATANQVNQFGGYTGMKPVDFRDFVYRIAEKVELSNDRIILGGDHLGPLTWSELPEHKAMTNAHVLIRQYCEAGFTKIHIDTSMHLADDDRNEPVPLKKVASRGSRLCETAKEYGAEPVYVIGSEVPVPGGSSNDEEFEITKAKSLHDTMSAYRDEFYKLGLTEEWGRVVAIVVQPGVEFNDQQVFEYERESTSRLRLALTKYPSLVFEGHSTDYQTKIKLKEMVEDRIAILKVGPALTFELRQALFLLCHIEKEMADAGMIGDFSDFINIIDEEMKKDPVHWRKHYHGSDCQISLLRKFSYLDRSRYYLPYPKVDNAVNRMLDNLRSVKIPLILLSQYFPIQYDKIREKRLGLAAEDIIKDRIKGRLDDYAYATLYEKL